MQSNIMQSNTMQSNIMHNNTIKNDATDNIVYVGTKPVMNYVLAVVTQFNSGISEVIVKARGKSIVRAVDTVELVTRQFLPTVSKKQISISTDAVETDAGTTNVSAIEITLTK